MKKKGDPRHIKRKLAIQELYASSFLPKQKRNSDLAKRTLGKIKKIDPIVAKHAPLWPLPSIPPLDLAILRLSVYELIFEKKTPLKVVIDEAVELSKEFGSESTSSFVNGVLGSVVDELEIKNGREK